MAGLNQVSPVGDGLGPAHARLAGPITVTKLLAGVLLAHLFLNLCVMVPSFGWYSTVLAYVYPGLVAQHATDSWGPMYKAWIHARNRPHGPLYEKVFFVDHVNFLYPPSALLLYAALDSVAPTEDPTRWFRIMDAISFVFLLALGPILWAICRQVETCCPRAAPSSRLAAAAQLATWCAITLSFYPMIRSYWLGQVQTWLNTWLALAMLAYLRGRKQLAGSLVGAMTVIKPYYAVLLVWGAWRREWRFTLTAGIVGALGLVAGVGRFGLADTLNFPSVLAYISRHGQAYSPNQSLFGLLLRLGGTADFVTWHPDTYPDTNATIALVSALFSLGLIGLAFVGTRHREVIGDTVDFAVAALCITMASPIAWEYHFSMLLPIFAVLVPLAVRRHGLGRGGVSLIAITYLVAATYLPVASLVASGPRMGTLILSHLFFSALTVLGMLYAARKNLWHAASATNARPRREAGLVG